MENKRQEQSKKPLTITEWNKLMKSMERDKAEERKQKQRNLLNKK